MLLREPLAAVIRLVRNAQGLSQEDLHLVADAKHIHNIEHAKSGISLEMLEALAAALDTSAVALLALAIRFQNGQTREDFLENLSGELSRLDDSGISDALHGEFGEHGLISKRPGRRTSDLKTAAILKCKLEGLTQKQTSDTLGIPPSTVNRLWKTLG